MRKEEWGGRLLFFPLSIALYHSLFSFDSEKNLVCVKDFSDTEVQVKFGRQPNLRDQASLLFLYIFIS